MQANMATVSNAIFLFFKIKLENLNIRSMKDREKNIITSLAMKKLGGNK